METHGRKLNVEQHPKGCRVTYNFDLCKACIILKENQEFSDNSEQDRNSRPPFAENQFSAKSEEQGSGRSFRESGNEAERTLRRAGQAGKSARGMPWHQEPKKDVTSCDKLRGGANIH